MKRQRRPDDEEMFGCLARLEASDVDATSINWGRFPDGSFEAVVWSSPMRFGRGATRTAAFEDAMGGITD